MTVSHLDMFYDTRFSIPVNDSNPSNNPNTELTEVPDKAEIVFPDSPSRIIDVEEFEAPNGKGFETAKYLIGRSMLDPDAIVVPL